MPLQEHHLKNNGQSPKRQKRLFSFLTNTLDSNLVIHIKNKAVFDNYQMIHQHTYFCRKCFCLKISKNKQQLVYSRKQLHGYVITDAIKDKKHYCTFLCRVCRKVQRA
jgi:hypothetical protein